MINRVPVIAIFLFVNARKVNQDSILSEMAYFVERNKSKQNLKKGLVLLILTTMLMAIILYLVVRERQYTEYQRHKDEVILLNKSNICKRNECCVTKMSSEVNSDAWCNLICSNFDTTVFNLSKTLETVIQRDCTTQLIRLEIDDMIFPKNTMTVGWISSYKFQLQSLVIYSTSLKNIAPGSFSERVFNKLMHLDLKNLNLSQIKQGAFYGLDGLKILCIYNSTIHNIGENVASRIKNNLEELNIYKSYLDLEKLTGGTRFDKLRRADLRFNVFGKVRVSSFASFVNCETINLSQSNVTEIEIGAFKNFTNLHLLQLNNNSLKHLSRDTFNEDIKNILIDVSGNPWVCDCSLKWLQDYIFEKKTNVSLFDIPLCAKPKESFYAVEFCPKTTESYANNSTTTHTTEYSNITYGRSNCPHNIIDPEFLNYTCATLYSNLNNSTAIMNCNRSIRAPVENKYSSYTPSYLNPISILLPKTKYHTGFENKTVLKVNISVVQNNNAILWYNAKLNSEYSQNVFCEFNLSNPVYIDGLTPGEMYEFCIYNDVNDNYLSPFDCRAYQIPLTESDLTWFKNDQKGLLIGLYCGYLLAVWLVGGLIIYFSVRINPFMLKGSKSVEIVKSRTSSKGYIKKSEIDKNFDVFVITKSHKSKKKTSLLRSLSDASIMSSQSMTSYISSVEPITKQLSFWRQERMKQNEKVVEVVVEPPKLPPRYGK